MRLRTLDYDRIRTFTDRIYRANKLSIKLLFNPSYSRLVAHGGHQQHRPSVRAPRPDAGGMWRGTGVQASLQRLYGAPGGVSEKRIWSGTRVWMGDGYGGELECGGEKDLEGNKRVEGKRMWRGRLFFFILLKSLIF